MKYHIVLYLKDCYDALTTICLTRINVTFIVGRVGNIVFELLIFTFNKLNLKSIKYLPINSDFKQSVGKANMEIRNSLPYKCLGFGVSGKYVCAIYPTFI